MVVVDCNVYKSDSSIILEGRARLSPPPSSFAVATNYHRNATQTADRTLVLDRSKVIRTIIVTKNRRIYVFVTETVLQFNDGGHLNKLLLHFALYGKRVNFFDLKNEAITSFLYFCSLFTDMWSTRKTTSMFLDVILLYINVK